MARSRQYFWLAFNCGDVQQVEVVGSVGFDQIHYVFAYGKVFGMSNLLAIAVSHLDNERLKRRRCQ